MARAVMEIKLKDGVLIKGKNDAEIDAAVELLIDRFPMLFDRVDDPNDMMEFFSPYYAYELFAMEIIENHSDASFLRDACAFINELADSGNAVLEEVLVLSVLEGLAWDLIVADKVRGRLNAKAVEIMRNVEEFYYGRPST